MHQDEWYRRLIASLDPAMDCGLVLWGDWWDADALGTILKQPVETSPWRSFPRGPGGSLVVDDPFCAASLYLRAFPQTPYGDFAGAWFNRYDTTNPFSLACTRWGAGWKPMTKVDMTTTSTRPNHGMELVAAYGQMPFVVGGTAHARMADMAHIPADAHATLGNLVWNAGSN